MAEVLTILTIVLVPMGVVLLIGTLLMELLLRDAPRRGKRPDCRDAEHSRGPRRVQVVTGQGEALRGTPKEIVASLSRLPDADFGEIPRFVTASSAERLLLRWEAAGRIRLIFEW
jgi:hypothetical protein